MQLLGFRQFRYLVLFVTGVTFLNLTMIQTEIVLLGIGNDPGIDRISVMLAFSEEGSEGEASSDNDSTEEETDFLFHSWSFQNIHPFNDAKSGRRMPLEGVHCHGYTKKFSPPPEVRIPS